MVTIVIILKSFKSLTLEDGRVDSKIKKKLEVIHSFLFPSFDLYGFFKLLIWSFPFLSSMLSSCSYSSVNV